MTSNELGGPEDPVCPFLGLAADRQSHFTYPHPGHRCFARNHPATTDARRQVKYCLSAGYEDCDRYQDGQRQRQSSQPSKARPENRGVSALAGAAAEAKPGVGTVVHAIRAGDSLVEVATRYGLTVGQIAAANGLNAGDVIAEGTRLVIPLGQPAASVPGENPMQRTAMKTGEPGSVDVPKRRGR
jgi:LysM repeat protein